MPPRGSATITRGDRHAPAQIPLDVNGFTGRDRHLALLDEALAAAGDQPTAVIISAVSGMAGIGKSATAVHWANRVRERFPDGQLYVNLRGFDGSSDPMEPAEAIRGFLDALGVPAQRVPVEFSAQAGLYRTLLADRRVLVLLDNARDAEQVRPLLPGAPGCVVLVTSRNRLASLVAAEGARPVVLGTLTPGEARQLLGRRMGEDRVAAEPAAVDEITAACAGLPLALVVTAARAAVNPQHSLADLARDLSEARSRLDPFDSGDVATDVRAVFSTSYRALSPAAARLFRLLGDRPNEAETLIHLGDVSSAAGRSDQARETWSDALAI